MFPPMTNRKNNQNTASKSSLSNCSFWKVDQSNRNLHPSLHLFFWSWILFLSFPSYSVAAGRDDQRPVEIGIDPFETDPSVQEDQKETFEPSLLENLDVAQPNPQAPSTGPRSRPQDQIFYSYRNSFSPRIGVSFNFQHLLDPGYLVGFQYFLSSDAGVGWEGGVDVTNHGDGVLHLQRRWIFWPHESLRPFAKAGLGVTLNPSENFSTLLHFENYQLRTAAGVEYWVLASVSLRGELDLVYRFNQDLECTMTGGYSWAW